MVSPAVFLRVTRSCNRIWDVALDVTWSCNRYSNVALDVAGARNVALDVAGARDVAVAGSVTLQGTAAARRPAKVEGPKHYYRY